MPPGGGQVNGNRVFVFSGEGQLMQMARDLVNRVTNRTGNTSPVAGVINNLRTDEGNVHTPSTLTTTSSSTDPSDSSADPTNVTDADGLNLDIHSVINTQQQQHNKSQLDINTLNSSCGTQDVELNVSENIDTVVDRTVLTNAEIHADNVYHQIQCLPTQHLSGRNNFQSIFEPSIPAATLATINNTFAINSNAGSNINNSCIIATEITTTSTRNSEIEGVERQSSSIFTQPLSVEGGLIGELSGPGFHNNVEDVDNFLISESTTTDTVNGNSSVE